MFFGLFWGDYSLIVLLPVMIFTIIVQFRVKSTFERFDRVPTVRRISGAEAARRILDKNGLYNVRVERVQGHLTDHYDPRANVIRLSEATYNNTSVAALGVAAHEAGHAVQHATGYLPIKLRAAIIPITQFGSRMAMPIFLIGFLLTSLAYVDSYVGGIIMLVGIVLFSFSAIFQLVTLPTEFNASSRALKTLKENEILQGDEVIGARRVLNAAAMTYVAALASSLAYILRFLLLASSASRRRH